MPRPEGGCRDGSPAENLDSFPVLNAVTRRLFELGCMHSDQVLSYQKMLGQLQEAGNTTTLAHYLSLLKGAGLVAGLSRYAGEKVPQRASNPKLLVLNTALMTAYSHLGEEQALRDSEYWGRLVESAVGSTLFNGLSKSGGELFYWASRNREVDFVLARGKDVVAIEIKSGRKRVSLPGVEAFSKEFKLKRKLLVGRDGISLDGFLLTPPEAWLA